MGATDKSLTPVDQTVWRVFSFYNAKAFQPVEFNEPILTGNAHQADFTPEENGEWSRLLAKRIDVRADCMAGIAIIEVKPHGGAHAMGQALLYATLYLKTKQPTAPVAPWVVCERVDLDAIELYERLGVGLWQAMEAKPRVIARSLVP